MDLLPGDSASAYSLFHQTSYSYLELLKPLANNTSDTQAEAHETAVCVVEETSEYSSPSCAGIVENVSPEKFPDNFILH